MTETNFHALAKAAGNRLKGYVLSYASGATGVFFFSLANAQTGTYSRLQQGSLIAAIGLFVLTVAMCLYELHIDARRFFNIAVQNDRPTAEKSWDLNEKYKRARVKLIYASYISLSAGALASVVFLVSRVVQHHH